MKYIIIFILLPFLTISAKAEEQIFTIGKSEILVPMNYQLLKRTQYLSNGSYSSKATCIVILERKLEMIICFTTGKEFSEEFGTDSGSFSDRNPDNNKKLPPSVLAGLGQLSNVWIPIKKISIGKFGIYENTNYLCTENDKNQSRAMCYYALVDSPYGVSFSVISIYRVSPNQQREWIHKIIKSIQILKGEPIKKTANNKTDFKPSFDCTKSRTFVEKTICADEYLSQLDVMLSGYYSFLDKPYFKSHEKDQLAQRAWFKRRNACKDADCIQAAYEIRIKEICKENESPCSEEDEREIELFRFPESDK
ncbi:MAG: hypothetical protein FWD67_02410 [Betaproteobacteria bacterium]|nr:hypothetical protein [Betaproteobacteria bacterium]